MDQISYRSQIWAFHGKTSDDVESRKKKGYYSRRMEALSHGIRKQDLIIDCMKSVARLGLAEMTLWHRFADQTKTWP